MTRPATTLPTSPERVGVDDPAPPPRAESFLEFNLTALRRRGLTPALPLPPGAIPTIATSPLAEPLRRAIDALTAAAAEVRPPLIIAGLHHHGVIRQAHAAIRSNINTATRFRRRLLLVHEDAASLADSFASADLTAIINDPHTEWFIGPGALDRLRDWLHARLDDALPSEVLRDDSDPRAARLADRVTRQLQSLVTTQQAAAQALQTRVNDAVGALTPLEARRRLEAARLGTHALRVLICGSRYTTFVRHSAEDLAAAFRARGHNPRIFLEADDATRPTILGYRRAVAEHAPDLIVIINYTRSMLPGALPPNVPCACWIQDAMPQFFDAGAGDAQSDLDMIAGNTMPELFDRYGYPAHAAMPYCVPASAAKFHPTPIERRDPDAACDILFVSHHSESPEAMRDRLASESSAGPRSSELMGRLFDEAQQLADHAATQPVSTFAERRAADAFRAVYGADPTPQQRSTLTHSMLLPLAGRVFRHQAIQWAASIADSRGLTLRLRGNGWDHSRQFAKHAAGPVEHGEPLRAAYQSAAVTLHLDINTLSHQRVFECALSGGLPIVRFFADALEPLRNAAIDELLESARPITTDPDGTRRFRADQSPLATRLAEQSRRLGLPPVTEILAPPGRTPQGRFYRDRIAAPFDAVTLLDGLDDIAFTDRASLDRLITRAVSDHAWRTHRSRRMREALSLHATTEVFARRLIAHAARVVGCRQGWTALGHAWPPTAEDLAPYRDQIQEILNAD